MPVYVISLDRSTVRFSSFLGRNSHLSEIIRARAIDGDSLDRSDLLARGLVDPAAEYSDACLGCAMSHACVWQIASGLDAPVTVAEDDAIFRHDFAVAAAELIGSLPPEWELVLWGWNFNSVLALELLPGISPAVLIGDQAMLRQNIRAFQGSSFATRGYRLLRAHGSPAYSLSPAGASRLLQLCLPIRPAEIPFPVVTSVARNDGIDMMMSLAYPEMQAFVSLPPLVVTEHTGESSTIRFQNRASTRQ